MALRKKQDDRPFDVPEAIVFGTTTSVLNDVFVVHEGARYRADLGVVADHPWAFTGPYVLTPADEFQRLLRAAGQVAVTDG